MPIGDELFTPRVSDEMRRRWDALLWEPGGFVLRNKLQLREEEPLRRVEYRMTARRELQVRNGDVQIPRTFGADHLRALHGHLFQDVYEWAGQFRNVDLGKNKAFAPHRELQHWAGEVQRLVTERDWSSMGREEFVQGAAEVYAYLNTTHPFREGNGRTGKLFMSQVAELSPYRLDFDKVEKKVWDMASEESIPERLGMSWPDPKPLEPVFDAITVDREPATTGVDDPQLDRAVGLLNSTYSPDGRVVPLGGAAHRSALGKSAARQKSERSRGG